MLEEILDIRNVYKALKRVEANEGAGGADSMQTDELRQYMEAHWHKLRESILNGSYRPSPVRKVEISKAGGGKRMLGIPKLLSYYLFTICVRNVFGISKYQQNKRQFQY